MRAAPLRVEERRRRVYSFHGVRIGCASDDALAAALHARLGRFPEEHGGLEDLAFEYRTIDGVDQHAVALAPKDARPVYETSKGEVLYSDEADSLHIRSQDRVRLACDPGRGQTSVSVVGPSSEQVWLLSHPLFTLPLIECLKRRGLFSLHAAGVASGSKAVIFPGTSGSGKSTLALALVRAGLGLLGDDMLFLARGKGGLRALAFPEALDLTDETIRLFPDLRYLLDGPKLADAPKRQLHADERFAAPIAWSCEPVALVFPRVAHADRSTLTPMDKGEALLELVPNVFLTEARSSQAHLDALSDLAATCDCYRLETGRDLPELAARVRALLEARA